MRGSPRSCVLTRSRRGRCGQAVTLLWGNTDQHTPVTRGERGPFRGLPETGDRVGTAACTGGPGWRGDLWRVGHKLTLCPNRTASRSADLTSAADHTYEEGSAAASTTTPGGRGSRAQRPSLTHLRAPRKAPEAGCWRASSALVSRAQVTRLSAR